MIKTDTNEDFPAMNGFEILQENIKEKQSWFTKMIKSIITILNPARTRENNIE